MSTRQMSDEYQYHSLKPRDIRVIQLYQQWSPLTVQHSAALQCSAVQFNGVALHQCNGLLVRSTR